MNLSFLYALANTPTVTPYINSDTFGPAIVTDIGKLVNVLSPLLITGGVLLFGGMLLFMAFKMLTAGSDQEQVSQARSIGTYAVLGLLIIISAYIFVKLIGFILGINIPI